MAAPAEALTARDKEKLKEKLALLQREYRKTFSRLQRAERAERVKSYVKKTVAEQNNLLGQVAAELGPADSISQRAPGTSESIPDDSCSMTNAVKTPSVTFSLEQPEAFCRERRLPENSGSECTDGEHERTLGDTVQLVPEKKRSRLSRSRRRGRPSVAPEERGGVACGGEKPGHEEAGLEGPQSPVFTRPGSSFELHRGPPRTPSAVTAKRKSSPVTLQPEALQRPLGGNVLPGVLSPLPGCRLEKSPGPSLEHQPGKDGGFATPDGPAVKDTVFLADIQDGAKEKGSGGEDGEDLCPTAPHPGGSEKPQERCPFGEPRSSERHHRGSPAAQLGSGREAEAASPLPGEASPAAPTSGLLDSCTVVEGLLFPVEYYVRTTRRMSRCQQEPNLAAVIQSQLKGQRRRSQRAPPEDRVASPAPPSPGLPASPPEAGQGRGLGSPLASNQSPGSSAGMPQSGGLAQWSRRARRKGRGRRRAPRRGAQGPSASEGLKGTGCLTPSEACCSEPQGQAENPVEPTQSGTLSRHQSESSRASPKHRAERTAPGRRESRLCAGAPEPPSLSCLGIPGFLKRLPFDLTLQEFHLPAEEFGVLQLEKVRASAAAKAPESVAAGRPVEHPQGAADATSQQGAEEGPGNLLLSPGDRLSEPLGLHTSRLLLSPANALPEQEGSPLLESPLPTPLFPLLGATPATEDFGDAPRQTQASSPREASTTGAGQPTWGTEEEQFHAGTPCPEEEGGEHQKPDKAAGNPEARQGLAAESGELCGASADQGIAEGGSARAPRGQRREGDLQLTSKLKNPTASCSVDLSAVWWEAADSTELCIVTAGENSVALWRRLDSGCWETIHTWSFGEVPVFQLVPLPGAHSHICVALGGLEITELRLLFHSPEDGCLTQSLLKAGNIKAVLGLSGRRLVSSCRGAVEVLSFPDAGGSCTRQALSPPEETALAFAAVDGTAEALVGLTATNCVAVWNLSTGQLLCQMPLGYAYPVPVCHQAYSDSGLLFVVLSHPRAKEGESHGSPAFQVVAFNPKTGRNATVRVTSLPPRLQGRYLEGDVREASAAAVLTSGAIAVWDLLEGECMALLPPGTEGSWSLVRWSVTDKCLLAGQVDGSVCIYSYAPRPCSVP